MTHTHCDHMSSDRVFRAIGVSIPLSYMRKWLKSTFHHPFLKVQAASMYILIHNRLNQMKVFVRIVFILCATGLVAETTGYYIDQLTYAPYQLCSAFGRGWDIRPPHVRFRRPVLYCSGRGCYPYVEPYWGGPLARTMVRQPPYRLCRMLSRLPPRLAYIGTRTRPMYYCSSGWCYPHMPTYWDDKLGRMLRNHPPPNMCTTAYSQLLSPSPIAPHAPLIETECSGQGCERPLIETECSGQGCERQLPISQQQEFIAPKVRPEIFTLNETIDPCDDFYDYVCSSWNKDVPIPADKQEYTVFDTLSDSVDDKIHEMFADHKLDNSQTKSLRNAAQLYNGCMDYGTREQVGLEPLFRLLSQLGGWPILEGPEPGEKGNWIELAVNIKLRLGMGLMINIDVTANPTDSKKKVIAIGYPNTDSHLRDWHLRTRRRSPQKFVEQYKAMVRNTAILLGARNESYLYKDAEDLTAVEIQILKMKRRQSDAKMQSMSDLLDKYKRIDWAYLFKTLFGIDVEAEKELKILVENSGYLKSLNKAIGRIPYRTLANYMLWTVIMDVAPETNSALSELIFANTRLIYGTREMKNEKGFCPGVIEHFMGIPVSAVYVKTFFSDVDKKQVENILKEIHAAFKETLGSNSWMDEKTKKVAIEKLDAMASVVGYPEWIFDKEEVESMYESIGVLDSSKFFDSLQQVKATLMRNKLMQWNDANHRVDASYSLGNPLMVNAFYSVWANTMFYPASLLDYPIYRRQGPLAMNFGSIGTILGHELTHAFDEDGSVIGPDGNFRDWWTADSKKNFEEKVKCFVDQYDKYIKGKNTGEKTVNDNIADNGGVRTSYAAYKAFFAQNPQLIPQQKVPGFEATMDQLFFLSFGSVWCGKIRSDYVKQAASSSHSPNRYRVTGTVSNMKEFSDAFGCKEGSPMNPIQKCVLW